MAAGAFTFDVTTRFLADFSGSAAVGLALREERFRESNSTLMKSDDVRTIFSVYEIWMSMEKERVAGRQERILHGRKRKAEREPDRRQKLSPASSLSTLASESVVVPSGRAG